MGWLIVQSFSLLSFVAEYGGMQASNSIPEHEKMVDKEP